MCLLGRIRSERCAGVYFLVFICINFLNCKYFVSLKQYNLEKKPVVNTKAFYPEDDDQEEFIFNGENFDVYFTITESKKHSDILANVIQS